MFEHTLEYNHELGRLEILDFNGNVLSYRDVTYGEAQEIFSDLSKVDDEIEILEVQESYGY